VERKKGGELLAAGSGGKRCTFVGFKADQGLRHRSNWVQIKKGLKKSNLMRLNMSQAVFILLHQNLDLPVMCLIDVNDTHFDFRPSHHY
jgi:hypothetical protein